MLKESIDRTSSTASETTRHTEETSTNRETGSFGTTTDMKSTNYGTTTSMMTTPGRTTPAVTRAETTWPSSTTQHMETTVPIQETTHYHSPSTPEIENEIEHGVDHGDKYEVETENEHEHTPISETDQPLPEPEPEPPFYPQPPPTPFNTGRPKTRGGRISSEKEERTAMIIGIVAGALIAVILVILLLLWLKSNGDRTYKTDNDKGMAYGQGPNAALLGNNSGTNGSRNHPLNGANAPQNGSLRNGNDKGQVPGLVPQKPKKRDSKDIKEWYV